MTSIVQLCMLCGWCVYIATPYGKGRRSKEKRDAWEKGGGGGGGEREEIGNSNGCNIQYSVLSH